VGRLAEAEALLEPLRERSGAVSRPVVSGHNLLMKAHAQAGNPDAARKLFAAMKARGLVPDAVTYNTLLSVFVSAGELLRAKAVLDKMCREGVAPDAWSYTTLLLGLGRAGQLGEAQQLLASMAAAGLQPNEVSAGAAAAARCSWLGGARGAAGHSCTLYICMAALCVFWWL
jgi:pentatricopeptide repeat protein